MPRLLLLRVGRERSLTCLDQEQNRINEPVVEYRTGRALRPIRLTPCSSDYETAVELTARMLGISGIDASRRKPCTSLLRLAKPGS